MKYSIFGINVYSDFLFPRIPLIRGQNNFIDVKILTGNVNLPLNSLREGFSYKITENSIFRFWKDIGKFKIENGKIITVDVGACSHAKKEKITNYILGPVFASLLHQRNFYVLHASAFNVENDAVAFVGSPGVGKSTLAMAMHQLGCPIVTDDVLPVQIHYASQPQVHSTFQMIRLHTDSITELNYNFSTKGHFKNYIDVSKGFKNETLPLKLIYLLNRGEKLKITDLNIQKSLESILAYSFNLSLLKNEEMKLHLQQCANIVKKVKIRRLTIPHNYSLLDDVVKAIRNDILTIK